MYGSRMWANLFTQQPQTVFGAYAQTANALDTLRQSQMKNVLSQIQLNAAPQLMDQALQQGTAKTSVMQNTAQYAPQLSALDVQQKQILNAMNSQKFQEQPQEFKQALALKAAQIDQIRQNISLAPQKLAQQQGRFGMGSGYNLKQVLSALSPAARAAYIASHPDQVNAALGLVLSNAQPPAAAPAQQQAAQAAPLSAIPSPAQPVPPMIAAADNTAQSSASQLPFIVASKLAANKSSVTNATTKRSESGQEIEQILNNPANDVLAINAAKYAGIAGKIQGGIQAWSKSNPQQYEDYLQFHNQYSSMVANVMRQLEALGVQTSTREEIRGNLLQPFDSMSGNPARAVEQYFRLKDQMHQLSEAASNVAQPVFAGARERQAELNTPKYDQSKYTVEIRNPQGQLGRLPVDEVRAAIKGGWSLG